MQEKFRTFLYIRNIYILDKKNKFNLRIKINLKKCEKMRDAEFEDEGDDMDLIVEDLADDEEYQ